MFAAVGTLSVANGQVITNTLTASGNGYVAFTNTAFALASGPTTLAAASNSYASIVATPAANWVFTGWSGSATPYMSETGPLGTNTDLHFVLANAVGIATFVQSARLTVSTIPAGGSISVNANSYADGSQIVLPKAATNDIFAAPSRSIGGVLYDFDHWEKTSLNLNLGTTANPNTISGLVTPATLTAVYLPHVDSIQVTLQSQANGNSRMTYGTNTYTAPPDRIITFPRNSIVSLSATPSNNYAFTGWDDGNTGSWLTDIATYQASPQTLTVGATRTFRATFKSTYVVTNHYSLGPVTDVIVLQTITNGFPATVQVPVPFDIAGTTRYLCIGYTNFGPTGGFPPAAAAVQSFTIPNPTSNYQVTWRWGTEYLVSIACPAGGTVSYNGIDARGLGVAGLVGAGSNDIVWVASGSTLNLTASPDTGYSFASWTRVNSSGTATLITPTLNEVISNTATYTPSFIQTDVRFDWYQSYGLNPNATGDFGITGDPDNDGLPNEGEFRIYQSLSNNLVRALLVSPLNCDSDGDGMDDNYEYFHMGGTNTVGEVGNQNNGLAMTSKDGIYGPDGNPDQDFHWDTTSGYLTTEPLKNSEEYIGPDALVPYDFATVLAGGTAPDSWANTIGRTVIRRITNTTDTADTSYSDTIYTGMEGMDDGFKWSWDLWQTNNAGRLISNTNIWPRITNTVPSWAQSRIFKPSQPFDEPGSGAPSYNVWYNPTVRGLESAGARRSTWVTVLDKYHASVRVSSNVYPVVRMDPPLGNPEWCVNPFLWDTDSDGMPDGWELTFGYDPWSANSMGAAAVDDGHANPRGKWYADDTTNAQWSASDAGHNRHYDCYLTNRYDPRTGYGYSVPLEKLRPLGPNTVQLINLEAIRGDGAGPFFPGIYTDDRPVSPFDLDSDGDGIWDGWEFYVGFDPQDRTDGEADPDGDGAQGASYPNLQEFQAFTTSTNVKSARVYLDGWRNKLWPTDPNDKDTDWDQINDGAEKTPFNYRADGAPSAALDANGLSESVRLFFEGAGLNPTSGDTDGDHLPDAWESMNPGRYGVLTNQVFTTNVTTVTEGGASVLVTNITITTVVSNGWSGNMNGTLGDDQADYDGDGLLSYQEYLCGAVWCWQFKHNSAADAWSTRVNAFGNYDPYDFFDPAQSGGGQWDTGPGGRGVYRWDPHYIIGPPANPVRWRFITAVEVAPYTGIGGLFYSTSSPGAVDSDNDGMDDFWEIYHGLNPLFGGIDVVFTKLYGNLIPVPSLPEHTMVWMPSMDFLSYPWIAGHQSMDPDQDGLKTIEETIQKDVVGVPYYHSDPSPQWMTDFSSVDSWVNLYFWAGNRFANPFAPQWFWSGAVMNLAEPPPSYMFTFESNEGFDTDNDNIGDRAELRGDTDVTTGVTDPLNGQSPIKRRALYLNGFNAAARTRDPHLVFQTEFRQFTVEVWARAQNPVAGRNQVIVERTVNVPPGSFLPITGLRRNFRIGVNAQGRPYASYDSAEDSPITVDAVAPAAAAMKTNVWAHLACTYGGQYDSQGNWVGVLRLFKDGILVAATPSSVIPANGWFETQNAPGLPLWQWLPETIVVGAADNFPGGWVDGTAILVPPLAGTAYDPPALTDFFAGWVDHIALWDGARSQGEIQADRALRMTRSEVGQAATNLASTTVLKAYYTFDNRPDPDHSPVSPAGFQVLNEYPSTYTTVPWWATAPDRSYVYDDYRYVPWIENMVSHLPLNPAKDGKGVAATGAYRNPANPYGLGYIHYVTGAFEVHPQVGDLWASTDSITALALNSTVPDLLPLRGAVTDDEVPMWDDGGTPAVDPYDSDGDGMSDEWEERYGLDPLDSTGSGGAYGDADFDGLSNLYEFFAHTDPQSFDSDGDGLGDFDSYSGTVYRTYGEIYSDMDGMLDDWEFANKLNPARYDAQEDPDGDDWSNYAEYMADTDPRNNANRPNPTIFGRAYYYGQNRQGALVVQAYRKPTMDDEPVEASIVANTFTRNATEVIGVGNGARQVFTGSLLHPGIVQGSIRVLSIPAGTVDFQDDAAGVWLYRGTAVPTAAGAAVVFDYANGTFIFTYGAGEAPLAGTQLQITYQYSEVLPEGSFAIDGLSEGDVYLFAFRDLNGDGQFDVDEPCGTAVDQPVRLGWGDVDGVAIAMFDQADVPWYHRFAWTAGAGLGESVFVRIYTLGPPKTLLVTKWLKTTRSFWADQDYRSATYTSGNSYYGLPTGLSYQWQVAKDDSGAASSFIASNTFNYATGLAAPVPQPIYPVGGQEVITARDQIRFDLANTAAGVELQVGRVGGGWTYTNKFVLPARDANGHYFQTFPFFFGDGVWTNGNCQWRARAFKPDGAASAWSRTNLFVIALRDPPAGMPEVSGDLLYFGKASGTNNLTNIVVEAFMANGFGGTASARMTYQYVCNTNAPSYVKVAYKLLGLERDQYYVRAFVDMNGNRLADVWEPQGFVEDIEMRPQMIDLNDVATSDGLRIIMRDRDTDSDNLPDSWEWHMLGTLAWGAEDDPDNDAASNLAEYQESLYDSNPSVADTDGDGLLDGYEIANGLNPSGSDTDHDGLTDGFEVTNGLSATKSDTDGDGLSDGAEMNVYQSNPLVYDTDGDGVPDGVEVTAGTDPTDPNSVLRLYAAPMGVQALGGGQAMGLQWNGASGITYRVQRSSDLSRWFDTDDGVRSGYGAHSYLDTQGLTNATQFYRVKVVTP
jgi:uncharacterized protein (DUF2141 family)